MSEFTTSPTFAARMQIDTGHRPPGVVDAYWAFAAERDAALDTVASAMNAWWKSIDGVIVIDIETGLPAGTDA